MKKKRNLPLSRRSLWLLCPTALALVSAAVRRWQMTSAFEGDLGLPIPGAKATVVLTCVLIIAVAVMTLLTARQPMCELPRGAARQLWRRSGMAAPRDSVCLTLTVAAAFVALAAAPALFQQGMQMRGEYRTALLLGQETGGNNGMLMMLTAVTSLLACLGLLLAGRDRFRNVRGGKGERMIMLSAVNGCLWLMESYRGHAANPVLWDYVPLLLAIIAGMLFYMDCAGLACGAAHPRRTLWLAGMLVVLSAAALADGCDLGSALLMISQMLAALAVLWRLPVNMEHLPAVDEPQVLKEKEEVQEEDEHV